MDLAKVNPRAIAALIVGGRLELDEVPMSKRSQVAAQAKILTEKKVVAEKKVKAAEKRKAKSADKK